MSTKLVIVESPAKARTLARFLGSGYRVEASIGHVRDLPESASEIPPKLKKEAWSRLGVNVDNGFEPLYVVPASKREQIKKLKALLKDAEALFLATDEDREGESISWHLTEVLKPKVPTKRLVFHEITKDAIDEALEATRDIDLDLVRAQEARRILDRLYGYVVSPLLWKKVRPRLSAGRVQSVAVRLVVERERARIAFRRATYWDLEAELRKDESPPFKATLVRLAERRIAAGRDFDPRTGKLKDDSPLLLGELEAAALEERLKKATPTVAAVEEKPFTERPAPPFTTSTLQQDANRKLRFSARRTMDLAQRLYENGYITYMRTDSTTLSEEALRNARGLIRDRFGEAFVPHAPRVYKKKVKNAQEAHEAVRPAGAEGFTDPGVVEKALGRDARRLYELIFRRTLACQMPDARGRRVNVEIALDDAVFQVAGKVYEFRGFLAAHETTRDAAPEKDDDGQLPPLSVGDVLDLLSLESRQHTTQPPARLTEATLVRELEARGIGRPSTYASIIETILRREYVRKQGTALIPTFTAFAVVNLMENWLEYLVDYGFTASMEDDLDSISLGKIEWHDYLKRFYHGNGQPGLKGTLEEVEAKIDPRKVCGIPLGDKDGDVVEVRVGKYGPFLSWGDHRAACPEDLSPDELTVEKALDLLEKAAAGPRVVGNDPATGKPIYAKTGRFGPYVQLGDTDEGSKQKPKMASLLEGMQLETISLEQALGLLSLPRKLGMHPESGAEVQAANGRYGPYVVCGKETRSLPESLSPLEVTLEQALDLLRKPKARPARRARREPLKELGTHPESGTPVRLLDGRFGPYVTDGSVNASIPRGTTVEEVTLDFALDLLRERAKRGGGKKKKKKAARGRKKNPSAKKNVTSKKATARSRS